MYFPFYFIAFALAEKYITSGYWVSYLPLDDNIPFVGEFVLAYLLWFPAVWGMGILLLFIDPAAFRRYIWSIMIGYTISLAVYFIFPNGQDLRPDSFDRSSIFTRMVQSFYLHDTNTNVLPSMHVIGASAVAFAFFDSPRLNKPWLRITAVVAAVLIDASTVLIKQHSILDVWAGLAVSLVIYLVVYQIIRRRQINKSPVTVRSDTKASA
jgi:membrane-associated phospholipid phosphatase